MAVDCVDETKTQTESKKISHIFFFCKKEKEKKKKLLIYTTVSFVTNNNLIVNRIINVSIQHEMMQPTIRWTLNNNNQLWGVLIKTIVH